MIEKYSPDKVAEMIISIDPTFHLPSDEQRPIISIHENPLEPAVVIAGAGSCLLYTSPSPRDCS